MSLLHKNDNDNDNKNDNDNYNNNRMDQKEGVRRHPVDCPSLFDGNKVSEKKDKCTEE